MLCSTLVLVAIPSRILFHRSHFFHFHSDRGQCVYMHSANCTVERNGIPDISEITVIPLFLDTFITLSLSLSFSLQRLYYRNYSRERCNYRGLQCTEERMFWLTYTIKFSREGCVRSGQIGEEKTKQVFLVTSQNNSRQQIIDKHFRYWQIALTVATLSLRCHPLPLSFSLSFSSFWPIFV